MPSRSARAVRSASQALAPQSSSYLRQPLVHKVAHSKPLAGDKAPTLTPALSRSLHCSSPTSSSFKSSTQFLPSTTAKMTTMKAQHGHSEACCNVPPVVAKDYKEKGKYEEIGGMKTYVTGPADAKKGILFIMDIFGYFPQTIQGADILAYSDDHQKYKVFIPDWFNGEPCGIDWYPPDNEEKEKKVGKFFQRNAPQKVAGEVPDYIKAVEAKDSTIEAWAIIGYCWGGKVVSLVTSSESNIFKVAAECHPAFVDYKDAEGIKIPLIMQASKEESEEDVKKFEQALKVDKHVEIFKDQVHGWMAARADLEDSRVKEEYTRGYKNVVTFFGKHI